MKVLYGLFSTRDWIILHCVFWWQTLTEEDSKKKPYSLPHKLYFIIIYSQTMWPTFALSSLCVELQIHRRNWKTTLSATVQTQDSWKPCQTVAVWVCFSGKQHSDKSTVDFWRDYKRAGRCSNEEMYNFECANVCSLWEIPLARFSSWLSKWIRGCVLHFLSLRLYKCKSQSSCW